jgi:RNA recognition motif-containing protein
VSGVQELVHCTWCACNFIDDFRVFVGDLGNDVNDDTLARSFSKYQSFLKAKVIRDRYTKKTKGYGFVSFKNPQDFMQAMREMNGKFVSAEQYYSWTPRRTPPIKVVHS